MQATGIFPLFSQCLKNVLFVDHEIMFGEGF